MERHKNKFHHLLCTPYLNFIIFTTKYNQR